MNKQQSKEIVQEIVDWLNSELEKYPEAMTDLVNHMTAIPRDTDTLVVCALTKEIDTVEFGTIGFLNGLINAKVHPSYRISYITNCKECRIQRFELYEV